MKARKFGFTLIAAGLALVAADVEASGSRKPPAAMEGTYVLEEPCSGWPTDTVCCGPGEPIRNLPLPTSTPTYVRNGDGRRLGVRWFAVDTMFEVAREGLNALRITPIGDSGPMEAVVLTAGHSRARTVRFGGEAVSVRDRYGFPETGMNPAFDLDRHYTIETEANGDLRLTYDGGNFTRVPDSVCRLRRVR